MFSFFFFFFFFFFFLFTLFETTEICLGSTKMEISNGEKSRCEKIWKIDLPEGQICFFLFIYLIIFF